MMNVMIVDDESAARRILREYCAKELDLQVVGEYGDGRSALAAIQSNPPDLLFLDIQIGASNGVALARSLDPERVPFIVFVTAYEHYALEAFEVSATDYLLKPFDEQRFGEMLARVRRRRDSKETSLAALVSQLERHAQLISGSGSQPVQRILAEADGTMHMLDVATIELVEADRNYVKLMVGQKSHHTRSSLQQAEQALQSQALLRISRSCLINVNHIREVNRTPRGDFIFTLAGGSVATSSEGYREPVRDYLATLKIGRN